MEVLQLISAVASSLNAAPSTTLSEVVSVITALASCIESLHQHQKAVNASVDKVSTIAPAQVSPS
jgi:DNA-binding FrmR family transcriptional regulator